MSDYTTVREKLNPRPVLTPEQVEALLDELDKCIDDPYCKLHRSAAVLALSEYFDFPIHAKRNA